MTLFTLLAILIPLLAGAVVCFATKNSPKLRVTLLLLTAILHGLCAVTFLQDYLQLCDSADAESTLMDSLLCLDGVTPTISEWLATAHATAWLLPLTSLLFFLVVIFKLLSERSLEHEHQGASTHDACLLFFLATMTLVITATNFGVMWVAVEATTLASAPLILYHRTPASLEAMWKYLLICSVGIGLALLGTLLLAVAGGDCHSLNMTLLAKAQLHPGWFKAAFIFILAGYGTKMGLAPFHTWLPDAHSEAPGHASALLSAALLNCSFLGILRFLDMAPDSVRPFCLNALFALGMISLAVAAAFIFHQGDFKRMLAYSSVEHMGLLAIMAATAIGNTMWLHCVGHSLIKMSLFLLAGKLLDVYGTRRIADVGGLFSKQPLTAVCWLCGILMICGLPPSPLFLTEFRLMSHLPLPWAIILAVLLFAIFAGMTQSALKMCMGHPLATPDSHQLRPAECFARGIAFLLIVAAIGGIAYIAENWNVVMTL